MGHKSLLAPDNFGGEPKDRLVTLIKTANQPAGVMQMFLKVASGIGIARSFQLRGIGRIKSYRRIKIGVQPDGPLPLVLDRNDIRSDVRHRLRGKVLAGLRVEPLYQVDGLRQGISGDLQRLEQWLRSAFR